VLAFEQSRERLGEWLVQLNEWLVANDRRLTELKSGNATLMLHQRGKLPLYLEPGDVGYDGRLPMEIAAVERERWQLAHDEAHQRLRYDAWRAISD
jgi:hypothetical protein